ncbi:hypothetical protein KKH19_01430 [Patescibacteria group bacterium]|nr:hypothetical protein [Patescibacteria group bacterium]MBU2456294.1 hypothetical protein [Patescibacteria group bacterium]
MFKQVYYKIKSYFPSKYGIQASNDLQSVLSHGGIEIKIKHVKDETGSYYVAKSINLSKKHILTSGETLTELEQNIKDAIFTAFQVPEYYCNIAI